MPHRYSKVKETIVSTKVDDDGDLDSDYSEEDYSDSEDDDLEYVDERESDFPAKPGETIDSSQVKAWTQLLHGNQPVPHILARERVIRIDRPSRGLNKRQRSHGSRSSDTKTISAGFRVNQFPNNFLEVRSGRLFCSCCQSDIGLRKMSITQHLQNKSHRENEIKKKSLVKQRATTSIEESVEKMLTKNTVDSYSYRRIVCKALLIAGISFQFLENLHWNKRIYGVSGSLMH